MTRERIISWARYMAHKEGLDNQSGLPVLVTTSPSVFDWLGGNCKEMINPLDIPKLKVHENKCENKKMWQEQFEKSLLSAIKNESFHKEELPRVEDGCKQRVDFKLGLFTGTELNPFFKLPEKQIPVCLVN